MLREIMLYAHLRNMTVGEPMDAYDDLDSPVNRRHRTERRNTRNRPVVTRSSQVAKISSLCFQAIMYYTI